MQNFGGDIITSASIGAIINGTPRSNLSYKGSISNGQAAEIDFSFPTDDPGIYSLEFEILSLNSVNGDFDATNNSISLETNVLDQNSFITISLLTDNFPDETSYTVTSQTTGEVIAEFGDLTRGDDNLTRFDNKICVDVNDCFTITINDVYGDGFCCAYGDGNLSVLDNNGNVLAFTDGNFGTQEVLNFCGVAMECALEVEVEITNSASATIGTGIILINASNGITPFQYSINGGTTFVPSNVFLNLDVGEYDIVVTDATGNCIYEETVVVLGPTSTHDVAGTIVNVDILPNPTDGVFKINVSNLPNAENYVNIEIYDIQGKLIQQRDIGKFDNDFIGSFSLYAYPAGTYLVRIVTPEISILERLVKQ